MEVAARVDIAIVEIGGTVGDIESLPFLEAVRQLRVEMGPQNSVSIHVTLVPWIAAAGELKSKPTQHSVKELLALGIQPEILICRVDRPLPSDMKRKIAHFTNVAVDAVIAATDVSCIYELPIHLHSEGLDQQIVDRLNIWSRDPDLSAWQRTVEKMTHPSRGSLKIALVGKYVHLRDSYKSLHEALVHGGLANDLHVETHYVDSEDLLGKDDWEQQLAEFDAILVPGGFGDRGLEGKIRAIRYAREHRVPFFGICLGMQMAVVEFARNACGLLEANTVEADPKAKHAVIHLMPGQRGIQDKGATMRLGAYPCVLKEGSHCARIYGKTRISERHRHRFEVNNEYRAELEKKGLVLSGLSPDGLLVEMVELTDHPHFVGCQFHPEFKSRPHAPHPLFVEFVRAAYDYAQVRPRAQTAQDQKLSVN
jgi:CTP synthase